MKSIFPLAAWAVVLGIAGCSAHSTEQKREATPHYAVTVPLQADTTVIKDYVSQIRSVRNIEIRAQEKGYLQNIYVDEGQYVHAGQVLFRIMPKVHEAELLKSEAEARAAGIEVQNSKTLADKNIVSKSELALNQAKLEQAKAEVALAKIHLSFTEIRAPFSGVIDRLPLKLGSLVDEGALLTTLSDNSSMFAYFNVSEPEYLNYQMADKNSVEKAVGLLLANNQSLPYKGTVETVEGEFNAETGNIAFRARFPNPNNLLRHGETGKVQMTVPLRRVLLIPQKATYEIQDKVYVYVIDGRNTVHARGITIGNQMPDLYEVAGGLQAGDRILLEGVQKVKEGDKIEPQMVAPKEAIARLKLFAE